MEQLDKDARLIATHILQSDGHTSFTTSQLFEDLCEMARALLKSPQQTWKYCDD
jgi:hypothetical protein